MRRAGITRERLSFCFRAFCRYMCVCVLGEKDDGAGVFAKGREKKRVREKIELRDGSFEGESRGSRELYG